MIRMICFIAMIAFLTACNEKDERMKIGIIAPLTGEGATYGASMKAGFDLAFKTVSDSTRFKLIYEDSKLDPKEGVNALNKLLSFDQVQVVYGAASSSVTLAIAPEAQKNNVLLFSSISTADDIKESGDYIFRNVPSNFLQGKTAADFIMKSLNVNKIAVLKENDDYGVSLAKSFINTVSKNGGEISIEETYSSTDTDFRTQLLKVKESGAKAIFIPGNYEESALILKQLVELNISIIVIGGDGSYSNALISNSGQAAEGFYCTHFGINRENKFYKSFESQFVAEYKRPPNVYEAYAYEAGNILKSTIEATGYNSTKIKEYLTNNSFNSLTDKITFDSFGEVKRDFGILQIKNGNFENID